MDDEQILELRSWAQRLASDDRADVRAAAKAIVMLSDELTALRAQQRLENDTLEAAPDSEPADVDSSLRARLRSFVGARDHADG